VFQRWRYLTPDLEGVRQSIIWKRDCHPINEEGRILREGVTAMQIDNRKLVRTGRDRGWL